MSTPIYKDKIYYDIIKLSKRSITINNNNSILRETYPEKNTQATTITIF